MLRRAAADAKLEAATGKQIGRPGILRHVQRILIAHVDHAGADLDPARPHTDRRQERKRRAKLAGKVMHPHKRAIDTDLLGSHRQLHRLAQRVRRTVSQAAGGMPVTKREETDALWVVHHPQHT